MNKLFGVIIFLSAVLIAAPPDSPAASCVCPDGLHVVVIQTATPRADWQARETAAVVAELEAWAISRGVTIRVGVVEYDQRGAWARRGMEIGAGGAYGQLLASTAYVTRGQVVDAATAAVRMLDDARAGQPCELALFMVYTKSHYAPQREQMLEAAAMLGRTASLMVGCPIDPGDWYCRIAPSLVLLPERYTEFPDAGRLAGATRGWLAELDASAVPCQTPTPAPTVTATVTVTAEPSATPTRAPIYIPIVETADRCEPRPFYADVVLVLDASTSMLRDGKLDAALAAARTFVGLLAPGDRVAVVGFNDTAWLESAIDAPRAETLAGLATLPLHVAEGTRLDLALDEAALALPVAGANRPSVVLLTDGLPNRVPWSDPCQDQVCAVLARAVALKASGARLITVGLGPDVLDGLLTAAATVAGDYYHAPDAAALDGIYRQIAGGLTGCSTK